MSDFQENLDRQTDICVLAFASGASRFEWGGTLARIGVDHVLFRDTSERWHQNGVKGIGDRNELKAYINKVCDRYAEVIGLGLSSGSYAAMLYSRFTSIDRVIAISPISGKGDALKPDFARCWHHRIEHGPEHPAIGDLMPIFLRFPGPPVTAFVSDGEGTELDRRMAERIGITDIRDLPGHSHSGLAKYMRDRQIIRALIL